MNVPSTGQAVAIQHSVDPSLQQQDNIVDYDQLHHYFKVPLADPVLSTEYHSHFLRFAIALRLQLI